MAKYSYRARDARGNLISSEMEAADEQELVKELEMKGYFLITAEIKGGAMGDDILAPFKGEGDNSIHSGAFHPAGCRYISGGGT